MQKVNLLRHDTAHDRVPQELFSDLSDTRFALSQAYARFNDTVDPELIDACVFEINAAQSRYNYLLRTIKERVGEAACKIDTKGVRSWV